eukprot:10779794-Ditylum_brightwellii.AAC.1
MKNKGVTEKTDNDSLYILFGYNSKLEKGIDKLESIVIALIGRVKKLEIADNKMKSDNIFVVGEEVQYSSKPAYRTFNKVVTIHCLTMECVFIEGDKKGIE